MLTHLRPAILMLLIMTVLTGLIYPLFITGIGQALMPQAADGSMVIRSGKNIGSELIGQNWSSDKYFRGRPSAAGNGYDATASSGSNLGPTSKALIDRIKADAAKLREPNSATPLPGDAVTASGSGLDPDISPQFAKLQIARVAKARNMTEDKITALVAAQTRNPALGLFGEPRVNVLILNLALDELNSSPNG